jgi:hypothetical protein
MGTAEVQGQIWGGRARDWAEVQEAMLAPSYDRLLRETAVNASTAFLDIGCGSGMFCQMAAIWVHRSAGLMQPSRCSPCFALNFPMLTFPPVSCIF